MAGNAAFGTVLKIGGTAGTAIVNVTSVEGPGLSTEMIDLTAHDSSGGYREKAPLFLDGGEVTLRLNWDPNAVTHKNATGGLLYAWAHKESTAFALTFPTSPVVTWTFNAYVTAFAPAAPFDGKLEASVTLNINGAPVLA
jgi:predicted secreted protein